MLIHHMIEYVIREGPMFEAMIMNKEINNPMFRFLFDNQSPAHTYYRWKLFSLLQGDSQKEWSLKEFRMFKGGSIWRPPPMNMYTQGMPEELIERDEERKGGLSPAQRDRLEQLIRHMTPERLKVADAMVFCIEHAEAADEICDCILESISNPSTLLYKKVARLYLVSDILHNCSIKITNASNYRRCLESRLVDIFDQAHQTFLSLESRLKAEGFKLRVLQIFRAWDDWAVYPRDFLLRLKSTFLGSQVEEEEEEEERIVASPEVVPPDDVLNSDLDGVPLDGAALLKGAYGNAYDDIDGIPMDDDIDGKPLDDDGRSSAPTRRTEGAFVPSRWEEVDPELIEEQAMTTSKWELLEENRIREQQQPSQAGGSGEDSEPPTIPLREPSPASNDSSRDGQEEARRARLREIEVKVMQYQDELESGKRTVKAGWTIPDQIEHHRRKLLRKAEKAESKEVIANKSIEKSSRRSLSPDDSTSDSRYKRSKRSKSSTPSPPSKRSTYRSRSRSPYSSSSSRRRRSRSPRRRDESPPRRRRSRSPEISSPAHKRRHSSSRHKHKHRH